MGSNDPATRSACELSAMLSAGETSSEEIVGAVCDRIERCEPTLGAYLDVRPREALLEEARRVDRLREQGKASHTWAGIPIAVKDIIAVKGMALTCGSRMLEGYKSPFDATVVRRIRDAGLIIIGKTNLDEFAMGSSNEFSDYHVTRNPHDPTRVPGGSSGGSAAAVAAHETILSLGSDTGGSVRQPAGLCGCVGFKPSYGRISRYGLVAYASSFDQIGPITKTVADAGVLYDLIAGHDPADATSVDQPVERTDGAGGEEDRCTIGVVREFFSEGLDPQVAAAVRRAVELFGSDGFSVREVSLPSTAFAIAAYYVIAACEASSNLARFDGVRYGRRDPQAGTIIDLVARSRARFLGQEVQNRIMLGTFALSAGYYDAWYLKAQKVRRKIMDDYRAAFEACDVLVHPVSPTAAWPLGEKADDPMSMYLSDAYTVPANLAGLPAISLPCGLNEQRLPVGVQLTAKCWDEARLLRTAARLEALLACAGCWPGRMDPVSADGSAGRRSS